MNLSHILTIGAATLAIVFEGYAQSYPQKTNLPTVYIETEWRQSITSKENYVNATLRYVDSKGETYYDALGIRGRGNSTWGLAKKPYRIKFNKKQEFLGPDHAKAKSWTLLANYADKSLMRNALASCLGEFAGQPFTAAAQFVDLVLNGQYVGNYQISDQIEVRTKRVDIVEQEDAITADSDITGGYLLEVDGFADDEPVKFTTSRGIKITIKSPDDEIIDRRQINYISNYIQEFENALFSDNFKDPENGYRKYVDENTLISWYVASEMTANPDAFWSTYIYKDQGDPKIYWGPMWDYDIAFNNCQRMGDMTRRKVLDDGFGADLTGVWIRRMWEDPWFINAVNEKWKSMVEAGLENHLLAFIDNTEKQLKDSQALDGRMWPIYQRVYDEYMLFSNYSATVDFLRKFVRERISYLTETFENAALGSVPTPPFVAEENYYYRIHNISSMKCADIADDNISLCGNTYTDGKTSQHWSITAGPDGYYYIINRATNKAITDQSPFINGKYVTNSTLAAIDFNADEPRQQWKMVPMPTGGAYAIVNRASNFAWNNSGGGTNDGNPFIAWDNDENNPNKPNRQWRIIRDEMKVSAISDINADRRDIAITYSRLTDTLRFITDGEAPLSGNFCITNASGAIMMEGRIAESISADRLIAGIYIISANIDGQQITCKFIKN